MSSPHVEGSREQQPASGVTRTLLFRARQSRDGWFRWSLVASGQSIGCSGVRHRSLELCRRHAVMVSKVSECARIAVADDESQLWHWRMLVGGHTVARSIGTLEDGVIAVRAAQRFRILVAAADALRDFAAPGATTAPASRTQPDAILPTSLGIA